MTTTVPDYSEPQLLNANALVESDVTALRILLEVSLNRDQPFITPTRLSQSLTRMDVAVVRAVHLDGPSPIVAMGTLSRVEALGRGRGVIQDVIIGSHYTHHRANLYAAVVGRLLARAQEFAMESVELDKQGFNLASDIVEAYGYEVVDATRIRLIRPR